MPHTEGGEKGCKWAHAWIEPTGAAAYWEANKDPSSTWQERHAELHCECCLVSVMRKEGKEEGVPMSWSFEPSASR
jgi:hypothetical protein